MYKPYLDEEEMNRAKMCITNIQDKFEAIKTELNNEKAYKGYLKEKLDSIQWDVNCLLNMCNSEDNENE